MPFQTKSDQIAKLKAQVDHMKTHLRTDRVRASKTIAEIIRFCEQAEPGDPLIHAVKENPFKDKKSCSIL